MATIAPAPHTVPESMRARLGAIRDQLVEDVNAAVAEYDATLHPISRQVAADITRAMKLTPDRRAKRIREIVNGYYRRTNSQIAGIVAEQVADAATYAYRYREVLDAYAVGRRHELTDRPGPDEIQMVPESDAYFIMNYGGGGARASLAYQAAEAKGAHRIAAAITTGDRTLRQHLRPWRKVGDLSKRLHGRVTAESQEATRAILRAIRESEITSRAARELQRHMRDAGTSVAARERMPRLINDLKAAARAAARAAGDEDAERQLSAALRRIERYQRRLASGQTTQNAYLELLQDIERRGPEYTRKAIEHWTYQKQRYNAERIMRTEKATAYRTAALAQDKNRAWVVGYIWRMHRGSHARFVRRRPGRLKRFGGHHCICEMMNGERVTKEVIAEYPQGGHPHCACTFEPLVNDSRLFKAAPSAQDRAAAEAWTGHDAPSF